MPKGVFRVKVDEEDQTKKELEKIEEPIKNPLSFFWQKENWLHLERSILKQGRVLQEEPEFEEEVDDLKKEEIKRLLNEQDQNEPLLKPLIEDSCYLKR